MLKSMLYTTTFWTFDRTRHRARMLPSTAPQIDSSISRNICFVQGFATAGYNVEGHNAEVILIFKTVNRLEIEPSEWFKIVVSLPVAAPLQYHTAFLQLLGTAYPFTNRSNESKLCWDFARQWFKSSQENAACRVARYDGSGPTAKTVGDRHDASACSFFFFFSRGGRECGEQERKSRGWREMPRYLPFGFSRRGVPPTDRLLCIYILAISQSTMRTRIYNLQSDSPG